MIPRDPFAKDRPMVDASDLDIRPGVWPHFLSYGGSRYTFARFILDEGEVTGGLYVDEDGRELEVVND